MIPIWQVHTATVVAAYLRNNPVPPGQVPAVIALVGQAFQTIDGNTPDSPLLNRPEPAVPIAQSVQHDHLYCLECGEKARVLKQHLRRFHGLAPWQYRKRWNLAQSYPLIAPQTSAAMRDSHWRRHQVELT